MLSQINRPSHCNNSVSARWEWRCGGGDEGVGNGCPHTARDDDIAVLIYDVINTEQADQCTEQHHFRLRHSLSTCRLYSVSVFLKTTPDFGTSRILRVGDILLF